MTKYSPAYLCVVVDRTRFISINLEKYVESPKMSAITIALPTTQYCIYCL